MGYIFIGFRVPSIVLYIKYNLNPSIYVTYIWLKRVYKNICIPSVDLPPNCKIMCIFRCNCVVDDQNYILMQKSEWPIKKEYILSNSTQVQLSTDDNNCKFLPECKYRFFLYMIIALYSEFKSTLCIRCLICRLHACNISFTSQNHIWR